MLNTIEYRTITAATPGELDRQLNESSGEGFELEHSLVYKDKVWGILSKVHYEKETGDDHTAVTEATGAFDSLVPEGVPDEA